MSIGPSMPLRLEKPEGIDLAQAARYFGARGGADAATQALLEKCAVPLLAAATPRAVWLEADPDSLTAAGILAGEDVAKHLEGCTAALLLAVTLGPGVDAQIRRAGVGDIAAGVASDALGSALAEQAAEAAEAGTNPAFYRRDTVVATSCCIVAVLLRGIAGVVCYCSRFSSGKYVGQTHLVACRTGGVYGFASVFLY